MGLLCEILADQCLTNVAPEPFLRGGLAVAMRIEYCLTRRRESRLEVLAHWQTLALPTMDLPPSPVETFLARFTRCIAHRHRCRAQVLRWINPEDFSGGETLPILLCHVRDGGAIANGVWITENDISQASDAGQCSTGRASLLQCALQSLPTQPWTIPEWIDQATTWIVAQLPRCATANNVSITQVRVSPSSSVLRVRAASKYYYFKAVRRAYGYEPGLITWLAKVAPSSVAPVVAADRARSWYLSERVPGQNFSGIVAVDAWKCAMKQLACLQKGASEFHTELAQLGVPDFRTSVLEQRATELLRQAIEVLCESHRCAIRKRIGAILLRVSTLAKRLASYGITDSIVHSDLNESNILGSDSHAVFIDWTYATSGHPFLALLYTLYPTKSPSHKLHRYYTALLDSYLRAWEPDYPRQALRECCEVAGELAYYYGRLINVWISLERRSEMPGEVGELQRLIEHMSRRAQEAS